MHFLSLLIFASAFTIIGLWVNFMIEKRKISNFSLTKYKVPEENSRHFSRQNLQTPKLPVKTFDAERQSQNIYRVPEFPIPTKLPQYEEPNKENFFHNELKCTLDYTPTLTSKLS